MLSEVLNGMLMYGLRVEIVDVKSMVLYFLRLVWCFVLWKFFCELMWLMVEFFYCIYREGFLDEVFIFDFGSCG